ncbi:MAG: CopD family protein [Actinomycetota bacterium]|nr:CopD family protein [Actinomycetota bacterium]
MVLEDALQNVAFGLVRIGSFTANAFLFGLPVLLMVVLRPSLHRDGADRATARMGRRLEGLVQAALWASGVGAVLTIVLQAVLVSGLADGVVGTEDLTDVLSSSFGRWHLVRLPLVVALAVMLVGKVRASSLASDDRARAPRRLWWGSWIALAVCLLATSSFSGHAAVSSPRPLALLNDVVHLASGALWFSGIVVLAAVLPDAARALDAPRRLSFVAPIVARFSWVALVSIGVVALTGTFNSFFNLEQPRDLVDSGYGRLLASKIAAFLAIVVLGAINHFYVRRRLTRAAEQEQSPTAQGLFKKTIATELALALLLMGLTGFLVGSARTRPSAAAAPVVVSSR